jgi:hypothetical protein
MKLERLDDDQIRAIVASQIKSAHGYDSDALSGKRTDNLERYEGEPYGDERDGRSQVMSRDVMETVELVMPSMVRTFLSADDVVTFEPQEQEDEAYADQATDYINLVLMRDNPGFRISVDWMKSALITGTSVVKMWWDETDKIATETYEDLEDAEFAAIVNAPDVEVVEHTERRLSAEGYIMPEEDMEQLEMQSADPMTDFQLITRHDLKIRRKTTKARLRWEAVPPEEFLINRRARTLDEDDNTWTFCAHRQARTIEELLADGYDMEVLERATENDDFFLDETEERFDDLDYSDDNLADTDKSQKRVWVYECYIKMDQDGDGISELRRITVLRGGDATEILEDIEVSELPFAELCPIRLPYRFYGWSLADLTKDLQRLKTTIWRMMMDSLYHTVFPRLQAVEGQVVLDDLLSLAPNSVIRVQSPGAVTPFEQNYTGAQAFPMMQYIDQVLSSRTGVNDLAGGFDGGALQGETARGVEEAAASARARVEMIARQFAETGWTRLAKLALKMLSRHQPKERMVRLRNEWVPMDPRSWNVDMDVKINVGLGVGSKQEQMAKLNMIAAKQEGLLSMAGPDNPVSGLAEYAHTLRKMADAADIQPDSVFKDPTEALAQKAQQPPPPNPEMMKAQAELQMKQQESQAKLQQAQAEAQMRAETDQKKAQMEAEIARFKAELQAQQERENAQLRAAVDREIATNKLALERDKMNMEHEYRMQELVAEKALEREKMAAGSRDGNGNIDLSD